MLTSLPTIAKRGIKRGATMGSYTTLILVLSAIFVSADVDRKDAFIGYSEVEQQEARTYLSIETELGSFDILLQPKQAPKTVEWLTNFLEEDNKEEKFFYRAESVDKGYALVQGQFGALKSNTSIEGTDVPNVRGSVALIPGTSQFFISLSDHRDFDGSFTIFGSIVDTIDNRGLNILSGITQMPVEDQVDTATGTVMQILVKKVPFQATLQKVV